MEKRYYNLNEIDSTPINRKFTGFDELDWLYGYTEVPEDSSLAIWGLPDGKISLWAGGGGVGKSRLAIEIAKSIVNQYSGIDKVLYFQNEVDLTTFANWIKGGIRPENINNFFVSDSVILDEQLKVIKEIHPKLIIVDSINMIREYGSGSEKNIKLIIEGDGEQSGYRGICKSLPFSHIIFLSQLNKDGEARGSTVLPHLVDTVINLEKLEIANQFMVKVGSKHRYGRTGDEFFTVWEHHDGGVKCLSKNRYNDKIWCKYDPQVKYEIDVRRGNESLGIYRVPDKGKEDIDSTVKSLREEIINGQRKEFISRKRKSSTVWSKLKNFHNWLKEIHNS